MVTTFPKQFKKSQNINWKLHLRSITFELQKNRIKLDFIINRY